MKVITCASYYGCGSSAVTDLISEFSGVESLGDYEFRFLHDIDGISDWGNIAKSFDDMSELNSLKNIFDF